MFRIILFLIHIVDAKTGLGITIIFYFDKEVQNHQGSPEAVTINTAQTVSSETAQVQDTGQAQAQETAEKIAQDTGQAQETAKETAQETSSVSLV